jgi:putative spermidine/putrescine transport system permease protein
MSMPGVLSGTVLVFVLSVSSYAIPLLLGGFKVITTPLFIVQNAIDGFDWPGGSSMAIIMFLAVMVALGLYIKILSQAMRGLK